MKKTENFIQDSLIVLLSVPAAMLCSKTPYICLLLCGAMLITLCIRSIFEKTLPACVIQSLLAIGYIYLAGSPFCFITLCTCRLFRFSGLVLTPTVFMAYSLSLTRCSAAESLLYALLLFAGAAVLYFEEKLILSYFGALSRLSEAVSVAAVNELFQKKLNRELVVKNFLADKTARLEERETISRNIHNSVGHTITAAVMTLDAADMLFDADPERAREKMNTATERMRESLSSIRRAVRVLDSESSFVFVEDLINELEGIVESFSMDTTIVISCDFSDISPRLRLPHEHNEFLCGALQELLSNGVRHGGADKFIVSLSAYRGNICLRVADNGKSDYAEENSELRIENGFGLKKLIAYTGRCGGSASFRNDHGFKAVIKLPVYEEDKNERTENNPGG